MRFISDKYGYKALFDENTGKTIRLDGADNCNNWKKSGPELLDISITNYCERNCSFCYRNSSKVGKHMSTSLYRDIINEAKELKVFQVALGGGNPNQHPDFVDFLKIARENNIIPSYTTNGDGMTSEILDATKVYCGALAVSWYEPYNNAITLIEECFNRDIKVNIHFVLDADNISKARDLLNLEIIDKVNAIIFLNYKPVGLEKRTVLKSTKELSTFLYDVINFSRCQVGFDSCMISHLTMIKNSLVLESVDYSEASRYSAFISEQGMVYPCSFMCGQGLNGESILSTSLLEIWQNSLVFNQIRKTLFFKSNKCMNCEHYQFCHGGCPCFSISCIE